MATLPSEQQKALGSMGGELLMDCYGGYMIARYVELNERLDDDTRRIARSVACLFDLHADGAVGYRGLGGRNSVYKPMQPDPERARRAYEKSRF